MNFSYDEGYLHDIEVTRKPVQTKDGEEMRDLARMRVRFNRPVLVDGEWQDKGGFWANVEMWGNRAKGLECLRKGALVGVAGNVVLNEWEDKETGEPQSAIVIKAKSVSILPSCVESIVFKKKAEEGAADDNNGDESDS